MTNKPEVYKAQLEKAAEMIEWSKYGHARADSTKGPIKRGLGLGFATLHPVNGTAAMTTADADGIIIAGLLFDAGPTSSPVLLQIGANGSHASHEKKPISLHDVFFRVGGAGVGRAVLNLEINSNDTIGVRPPNSVRATL